MRGEARYQEKSFFKVFRLLLLLVLTLVFSSPIVLQGCAAGSGSIVTGVPKSTESARVEDVPFYPQLSHQCGPASLAGVLNFYGGGVTPDEIAEAIFRKDIRGTATLDMVLYSRKKRFSARWYSGSADDIWRSVDEGIPLIVMVDFGFANVSINHYMVVVGYVPEGVIANSGKTREKLIPWDYFLVHWDRAKRWTLRIEPKTEP